MQKIIKILGMIPEELLVKSNDQLKCQYFEKMTNSCGIVSWVLKKREETDVVVPSPNPIKSLYEVIGSGTLKKKNVPSVDYSNSSLNYDMFVDLIYKMLAYKPNKRISPEEALSHPFISAGGKSY